MFITLTICAILVWVASFMVELVVLAFKKPSKAILSIAKAPEVSLAVVPEVKYPCDNCKLPLSLLHYSVNAGLCGTCTGKFWCNLPPFDTIKRSAYKVLQVMGLLCRQCHNSLTYTNYVEYDGLCGNCTKQRTA